jgi:predicted Rossmann fold nucleotide-binding protein DprA/Smf involved in DNA uptake
VSYDTNMARRAGFAMAPVRSSGSNTSQVTDTADELAVRAYLRALVDAPARAADRVETTEASFVDAAARWSARSGVDRKTLSRIGVDRRTLDAAGLKATPVAELVRRQYGADPLSVADLARRSGVSPASVRQTVYDDESDGLIEAVETEGRRVLYRLVR